MKNCRSAGLSGPAASREEPLSPRLVREKSATITYAENDEKRERCKAFAVKLGGDPDAMFFEVAAT